MDVRNPVIRKEGEIVLCIHCGKENKGDFRYCNFCGKKSIRYEFLTSQQHLGRVFGTTSCLSIPEEAIDARIKDVIDSHLKNTGTFEARKNPIMKAFEEFLHSSKQISRSLTTAIPDDVIRFLAFKDVKGGGRTVVHDVNCYNIGEPELSQDCGELGVKQ